MAAEEISYLVDNTVNRVYLITYSQLDSSKFPTRQSFGIACVTSFGGNKVKFFAVGKEIHETTGGEHYHVAIRLNVAQRWKSSKEFLKTNFAITVNYAKAPFESMYAGAYRYLSKKDNNVYHGSCLERHPDLSMIGQNQGAANANAAYRIKCASAVVVDVTPVKKKPKYEKITKLDVADFLIKNKINTHLQLMAVAAERKEAGDRELAKYVMNLNTKARCDLINDAWLMHGAQDKLRKQLIPRMDLIRKQLESECICDKLWLKCAEDVLVRNEIPIHKFSESLRELMQKGRGKYRNILLIGPTNCAKTFLLEPITHLFDSVFSNPPSSLFSWLGVENASAIFLNDFRWAPPKRGGCIEWDALLRLLEGGSVTLPAPMNSYAKHIEVTSDLPIMATSSMLIRYWKVDPDEAQTDRHGLENEMMESRWNVFKFHSQIHQKDKISDIPQCKQCFARLIMGHL